MGYFATHERRGSLENPATSLANADEWLRDWAGGAPTKSGARINERTALNLSAVYAAVRVLTDTVASMPLVVYRRLEPRGKERAPEHPVYRLLHDRPNPEMSAFTFREALEGHLALWGNAYAEIERNGAGRPVALWPITPDRVTVVRQGGVKVYVVSMKTGERKVLAEELVLHIPGFGFDGLVGYGAITLARESLGLTRAAEEFGAYWFGNGSVVSGVLEHPNKLGDTAAKHLRESWAQMHQGLSNAHRLAILEEGMTWKQIGVPPEDAQFLGTRKFQTAEVARWFKVPPHMIGDLERSTNNNIEHQGLEFVTHTARPTFVRWEQPINHQLFTERERREFYAEFLMDALLRGDTAARSEFYKTMTGAGIFSINDVRELENRNPVEGGDIHLVPLNMIPLDQAAELPGSQDTPPAPDEDEDDDRSALPARQVRSVAGRARLQEQYHRRFLATATTAVGREVAGVRAATQAALGARDLTDLHVAVDEFYEGHRSWLVTAFLPLFRDFARAVHAETAAEVGAEPEFPATLEEFVRQYTDGFARRDVESSTGQLRQIMRDSELDNLAVMLEKRLGEWEEKKPAKVARSETWRSLNANSYASYQEAGVTAVRWVTRGETCPYCNTMNGRVVGIREAFIPKGASVDPGDGREPLKTYRTLRHPPLHYGCDCVIAVG